MDKLISSTRAASGSLGLKLAAAFVAAFLAVVVVLFAMDLFSSVTPQGGDSQAPVDVGAIDPKLESELRKAVDFEGLSVPNDVRDPFIDRGGLSDAASRSSISGGGTSQGTQPGAQPGPQPGVVPGPGQIPVQIQPPDPVAETRARFDERDKAVKRNETVGPLESVFSIDDLQPVGFVGGGSGAERIIFFSQAVCKTFSFPVGTRFFDGSLRLRLGSNIEFVRDDGRRVGRSFLRAKPECLSARQDTKAPKNENGNANR